MGESVAREFRAKSCHVRGCGPGSATLADVDAQPPTNVPTGPPPARVGDAGGVLVGRVGAGGVPGVRAGEAEVFAPAVPVGLPLAGPRRMLWRLVLAAFIAMIPVLCTGGIAVAFHLYDRGTKPNRSTPAAAADQYLQELLVDRDPRGVEPYRCADAVGLTEFEMFWQGQEAYAASHKAIAKFTWEVTDTPIVGNSADVTVDITESTSGPNVQPGRSQHTWILHAQKGSDWRICSATPG